MDIDVADKSRHELTVKADVGTDYNVGLIVGSSGSGKTTLAEVIFGADAIFRDELKGDAALIDQFPEEMSYDDCVHALTGVGLTQVPCWIRPAFTLSTGQRARAAAALSMCDQRDTVVIDEWTSVVDRTIGKIMSHCVQKFARWNNKRIVLLSCHYDVVEWLDPDWIIDCNTATYEDRRLLQRGQRKETIAFDVRTVDPNTWLHFKKYHYLTGRVPPVVPPTWGLFLGQNQVGFCAYTCYVPHIKGRQLILHCSRVVIHPDYCGLGLGGTLVTVTAGMMKGLYDARIMGKGSNLAIKNHNVKDPMWKLHGVTRQMGSVTLKDNLLRVGGFRTNVRTYSWEYTGPSTLEEGDEKHLPRTTAYGAFDKRVDYQRVQSPSSKTRRVQMDGTGG
jgi:ABC-type lipoprotein export system ATPase subunit